MKAIAFLAAAWWAASCCLPAFSQEPTEATNTTSAGEVESTFDTEVFAQNINSLLKDGQLDEAEQRLQAALEAHPESFPLGTAHWTAYDSFRRAGRLEQAAEQLELYIIGGMDSAAADGRSTEWFARELPQLLAMRAQLGGQEQAFATLDRLAHRAAQLDRGQDRIMAALAAQRAGQLARSGRVDDGRALLDEQQAAAEEAFASRPDDVDAALRLEALLAGRVALESSIASGRSDAAWTELLDFLHQQAQLHRDVADVGARCYSEHMRRAQRIVRTDPDAAEALLERIEGLSGNAGVRLNRDSIYRSPVDRLRSDIERYRKMFALVGTPAALPEEVDGWVNGEPLTAESLRGKVVLLDFFAVWCGPCIATFPHLRDWHDRYADQGFEIIGISEYHKYGWDEEAGRSRRGVDEIEPQTEREAMQQFADHHELRHPIVFVANRELFDHYLVNGIPHAVIIDRQGNVRLFRIGSGAANAADLEQAIEQCLAESP